MASAKDQRLDRLAGDGHRGGGLPLPPLLQTVAAELLDHGTRTIDDLLGPVEKAVPKRARVEAPDMYPETSFAGLIADVLAQFKSVGIAKVQDGNWSLTEELKPGSDRWVIPPRKGKHGGHSINVLTKAERDVASMEAVGEREIEAIFNDLWADRAFAVNLDGNERSLQIHPLARLVPPRLRTGANSFDLLLEDIRRNGVREPIVLFDGQVLEGRHRVAIAAALKLPLNSFTFNGAENDARERIASILSTTRDLNKLSLFERGMIAVQLYVPLEEAAAEARKAEGQQIGGKVHRVALRPNGSKAKNPDSLRAAAQRSNGLASWRTLRQLRPVLEAPNTLRAIRRKQITKIDDARATALKELGRDEPVNVPRQPLYSAERFRQAAYYLDLAIEAEEQQNTGNATYEQVDRLLTRLEQGVVRARELIDRRRPNGTP